MEGTLPEGPLSSEVLCPMEGSGPKRALSSEVPCPGGRAEAEGGRAVQ